MNLQLVKDAGLKGRPCRIGTMDEDIPLPGSGLRPCHRAGDSVGHIRHQWIVRDGRPRWPVTGHENWDTVVVITAPVIDLLHGVATGEDRAGRFYFLQKLSGRTGLMDGVLFRAWGRDKPVPLVQPHEAVAARVTRVVVWTSDVSVE